MNLPAVFSLTLINVFVFGAVIAKPYPQRSARPSVAREGICGVVTEKRGNQMPNPDALQPANNGKPVVREVFIFPVLTMAQVTTNDAGFITDTNGVKAMKTTKSDLKGHFCVYGLAIGTYSVLVREPQGLYANVSDGGGRINPVTVKKGKITTATVEISHGASF